MMSRMNGKKTHTHTGYPILYNKVCPTNSKLFINKDYYIFHTVVETRWRFGWLRAVFTRCASSDLQFGALSGGGGTREAGGTVAESLVKHRSTRKRV